MIYTLAAVTCISATVVPDMLANYSTPAQRLTL